MLTKVAAIIPKSRSLFYFPQHLMQILSDNDFGHYRVQSFMGLFPNASAENEKYMNVWKIAVCSSPFNKKYHS